jgi:uncharacterized membrane protein HdeD (DUF308 family)
MSRYNQFISTNIIAVVNPLAENVASLYFFGILLIALGVFSIIRPQTFWHLRVGRKIPGVKPSNLYLHLLRFGGIMTALLGLVIILNARSLGV